MRAHHKSVPLVYPLALLCLLWAVGLSISSGTPTNLYSTQFELAQGYNPALPLAGQNGWTKFGSGGNGLTNGFFSGQGQQAYVGLFPPAPGDSSLFVWHPINFSPVAARLQLVKFTALMSVVGPSNGEYDFFQWHVYNRQAQPLIVIDFDTGITNVGYFLDGTQYLNSGVPFAFGATYTLTVTMNFALNLWSATLNSALVATNQPMTTTGKELTLGDVDAVWNLQIPNAPGDNFMVFDNYTITAEYSPPPPPVLSAPRFVRSFDFSFPSQNGFNYVAEFKNRISDSAWTTLMTMPGNGGSMTVHDDHATNPSRFYRVRTASGAVAPILRANGFANSFRFDFLSQQSFTYFVEFKTQFQAAVWSPLTNFPGNGGLSTVFDDSPASPARFYRVRAQ
jgi:hypothetical protein